MFTKAVPFLGGISSSYLGEMVNEDKLVNWSAVNFLVSDHSNLIILEVAALMLVTINFTCVSIIRMRPIIKNAGWLRILWETLPKFHNRPLTTDIPELHHQIVSFKLRH